MPREPSNQAHAPHAFMGRRARGIFANEEVYRLPPGTKKPAPNNPDTPPGIIEYREKFDAMKHEFLGDRPYWYLNLIGRDPRRTDKGKPLLHHILRGPYPVHQSLGFEHSTCY
jgi:hypothetical protein